MAEIDSRNAKLGQCTQIAQQIKTKIKQVARNKNISVVYGTDTAVSLLTKIDSGTIKTPTNAVNITQNGTVDVTNYATANVSVVDVVLKNMIEGNITKFKPSDYGITKVINAPIMTIDEFDLTDVTEVGESALYGALATKLILSSTTLKLNDNSFFWMNNVEDFTIGVGTNITQLGEYTFSSFGADRPSAVNNRLTFDLTSSTFTTIPQYCFGGDSTNSSLKYCDIYLPSTLTRIEGYAFANTTYTNLFFKNIPTLASTTAKMASSGKYFFLYNQAKTAKTTTNWSNSSIVSKIYGYSEPNTFSNGDTLPTTDTNGNTLTWYSSVGMTSTYQVTTVSDATQMYYCTVA